MIYFDGSLNIEKLKLVQDSQHRCKTRKTHHLQLYRKYDKQIQ